jgi:hypothetical protein
MPEFEIFQLIVMLEDLVKPPAIETTLDILIFQYSPTWRALVNAVMNLWVP